MPRCAIIMGTAFILFHFAISFCLTTYKGVGSKIGVVRPGACEVNE